MAKFTSKNIYFKDGQKAIFGSSDDSSMYWDGSLDDLRVSSTVSGIEPTQSYHLTTKAYVDTHTGLVTNGDSHDHAGGDGAQIDHGGLAGLGDDDHTIYSKVDGTRSFSGVVGGVTPTDDEHLTTKDYVDTAVSGAGGDGVLSTGVTLNTLNNMAGLNNVTMSGSLDVWGNITVSGTSPWIDSTGVTYENLNTNGDVGTGATQVSQGSHSHSGLVTNGDSHDHSGGDGAQINHTTLSNIGSNTHSQIDTHVGSTANPHSVDEGDVLPDQSTHSGEYLTTNGSVSSWSTVDSSPLTTKGDLYTYSTVNTRLAAGTNTYVLIADSAETTGLSWADVGVTNGDAHDHAGGAGAQIDHGGLTGLGDDDHTIYSKVDGTRAFSSAVGGVTPTSDAHLTTKAYVDTAVSGAGGSETESSNVLIDQFSNMTGINNLTVSGNLTVDGTNNIIPDQSTHSGKYLTTDGSDTSWSTVDSSPLTTKGDLYVYSTGNTRLAVGTNDYVLTADSTEATGLKWAESGGALHHSSILSSTGTYNGETIDVTVDDASSVFGSALYCAADFHYERALASGTVTVPAVVMAVEAGSGSKKVMLKGQVCNTSWNFSSGLVYLDTASAGGVTQDFVTITGTIGNFVQEVGYALSADTLYFNPQYPMVEI